MPMTIQTGALLLHAVIASMLLWQRVRQAFDYSIEGASAMIRRLLLLSFAAMLAACSGGSGFKSVDHQVGTGDEAVNGASVTVHYTGWLYENGKRGKKFDSSRDGSGEPFTFRLGGGEVIEGWDVGVRGMKVGGKRELIIPPEMGYGATGSPGSIPPNATLDFEVELLKVSR